MDSLALVDLLVYLDSILLVSVALIVLDSSEFLHVIYHSLAVVSHLTAFLEDLLEYHSLVVVSRLTASLEDLIMLHSLVVVLVDLLLLVDLAL